MYRTYRLEGNEKFVIGGYDGDCTYYTVCENEQEYEEENEEIECCHRTLFYGSRSV